MSIQDINTYVDGIFNQKLNGSGDLSEIALHFDLMKDRMDQLMAYIHHYTNLEELREQPWMMGNERLFKFVQAVVIELLFNSDNINRDVMFLLAHPFDKQTDAAKFNVYAMNLMAFADERLTERLNGAGWIKRLFKGSKHHYVNQYYNLITEKIKMPEEIEGDVAPFSPKLG